MEVVKQMKKSLLAMLFAVALAVPAMAEGMWIGGSASYYNTNVKDTSTRTSWEIAPEFGFNVNENWDLGVQVAYGKGQNEAVVIGDLASPIDDVETIGVAPFARYKLMEVGSFNVYAKGSIFYKNSKLKESDVKVDSYGITIVPVVEYMINDAWSISAILNFAELGYTHAKADQNDVEGDEFGFNVNDGNIFSVGISYHF